MNWIWQNFDLIMTLALDHLRQSLIAVFAGLLLSLPLGWVAWRVRPFRAVLVSGTGLLYTIPSLALLMILPVLTGLSALSEANLVIALTLYALAILVRCVVDGLDAVDPQARAAARALGYGHARRVLTVDLPLAGPVILAGFRVAVVSTVALATVGILVGVSNLGYLFTNGLQRRILAEVFAGILAVAVLALLLDLLIVLVGRWLMPWTRRPRREPASSEPNTSGVVGR